MIQYTMNIHLDNIEKITMYKKQPPHPSYIAGFIDGDGCVFIRKIEDGYQSGIAITQCRTNILQILRYHFGGSITTSTKRNNKVINAIDETTGNYHKHNVRNQYNLLIRSNEYSILLDYIRHSFIIKQTQIECLYEFNKITNLPNKLKEKEQLFSTCSTNNEKSQLDANNLFKLNIEYIQGLFDAEGCVYIDKNLKKIKMSISQKNHPLILFEIKSFLNFGTLCEDRFVVYKKKDCLTFIKLLQQGLIVKYNQVKMLEIFLTTNDNEIKEKMYIGCNKEKHEIEVFDKINFNDEGKEGYNETIRLRELKQKICKEITIKQFYKEKSIKMTSEGNHNYGKTFSDEIKKKMSTSIRNAKQGVTDETIIKVRELIANGHKNTEIQKMLNLQRHTVTRIKNGLLVCRTEETPVHTSMSQEDINISKRKIKVEEIIQVIEKSINGFSPKEILTYLTKQRYMYNIENTITIDIIKNIKRSLTSNKPIIYQKELTENRYQYYCYLVTKYSENFFKKTS